MTSPDSVIKIATLNIQGQSGLTDVKQKQIEDFLRFNKIYILNCQEIRINSDSFQNCHFISSNYNIIQNNSPINQYGTAVFVKNEFCIENIKCDTNGRAIVYNIENVTLLNCYLHSGNDKSMRQNRELYFSQIIPQMLTNKKACGVFGADFNCISDKQDTMKYAEQKISPGLKKFLSVFSMSDSFRCLFPQSPVFSRYHNRGETGEGASRLDRIYHYGEIKVKNAEYIAVSFSDHHSLIVEMELPSQFSKSRSPKSRPLFKASPSVVKDAVFKARLQEQFKVWSKVKANLPFMCWWEEIVKPGMKKLLILRGKEINRDNRGKLNLLLVRQAYLVKKLHMGLLSKLKELEEVHI